MITSTDMLTIGILLLFILNNIFWAFLLYIFTPPDRQKELRMPVMKFPDSAVFKTFNKQEHTQYEDVETGSLDVDDVLNSIKDPVAVVPQGDTNHIGGTNAT